MSTAFRPAFRPRIASGWPWPHCGGAPRQRSRRHPLRRPAAVLFHGGHPCFSCVGAATALVAWQPGAGGGRRAQERWPDVIDQVKNRNPILASLLGSAHPVGVQDKVLIVAFGTEFNRKSAESNRQLIETVVERVYGTAYRLRCTVRTEGDGGDEPARRPRHQLRRAHVRRPAEARRGRGNLKSRTLAMSMMNEIPLRQLRSL